MKKEEMTDTEVIKRLLILALLKSGVSPAAIAQASGMAEMTIRGQFPMSLLKKKEE